MYESKDNMVSHPKHYQSETGLEVIDVIEAFTFDLKGIEATDTGNIIKYICRWKQKNGVQDLEKAMWYLQHLMDHVKKLEAENAEKDMLKAAEADKNEAFWIVETREKAEEVIDYLKWTVGTYGCVTLADFKKHIGDEVREPDEDFGWVNLDSATIGRCRDGRYIVNLPTVCPLK